MYQSPTFSTVVSSAQELQYWVPTATPRAPFFPTLVHITSEFNRHTILLRQPVGHPVLASRKPDWQIALNKALRECHADLRGDINLAARAWWSSFIGCAESGLIPASGLFSLPGPQFILNEASFSRLLPIPWGAFLVPTGAAAAHAAGHIAAHLNTVNSSILSSERRAPQPGAS